MIKVSILKNRKFYGLFLKRFLVIAFCLFSISKGIARDPVEYIIENAARQLNYLNDYNQRQIEEGKSDEQWFIYFLGGTVKELKNIIDDTNSINETYLSTLNDRLELINNSEHTTVYVAITLYDAKIVTPLFPRHYNSLALKEKYIKDFFNDVTNEHVENFTLFTEEFKKVMESIYKRTWLSEENFNKPNILLPFSMKTNRVIISKKLGENPYFNIYDTYCLYYPIIEDDFEKDAFNQLYRDAKPQIGTTKIERKIEKSIIAIEKYFVDRERPDVTPCQNLLYTEKYRELENSIGENDIWIRLIKENPCILDEMFSTGGLYVDSSQFEEELQVFVCAFLYPALAVPLVSIVGEATLVKLVEALIEKYGAKKVKDVSQAIAQNIIIQTAINFYFGPDNITGEKDINKRWLLALKLIDKADLTKDALIEAYELNLKADLILTCLNDGLQIDIQNLENTRFNVVACAEAVATAIGTKVVLETGAGAGKKIYEIAKNNPERFIRGLREVLADAGKEGTKSFYNSLSDIYKSFDLKDDSFLRTQLNVERKYGEASDSYVQEKNGENANTNFSFSNFVKDIASDVEYKIAKGISKTKKLGVNISLKIDGFNSIKATLLEELQEEGSYKIVFAINDNVTINSIDDFLQLTTDNRRAVLDALNRGKKVEFGMFGGNASKYFGKTNVPIKVNKIEVHTKNIDGSIKKSSIYEADETTIGTLNNALSLA